ncbi:hypothetical protein FNV43_RR09636 [Rhamnella rubrinervis]|uniref:Uncharacterized protein n=1 Tax=Rhamnella rubrinervis TaxID=2594499 RepID=A0A8K0HBM4_9ROSA|nr:hypothetical protein FNV43_RR09636 [Rhamnella rubrinervis]
MAYQGCLLQLAIESGHLLTWMISELSIQILLDSIYLPYHHRLDGLVSACIIGFKISNPTIHATPTAVSVVLWLFSPRGSGRAILPSPRRRSLVDKSTPVSSRSSLVLEIRVLARVLTTGFFADREIGGNRRHLHFASLVVKTALSLRVAVRALLGAQQGEFPTAAAVTKRVDMVWLEMPGSELIGWVSRWTGLFPTATAACIALRSDAAQSEAAGFEFTRTRSSPEPLRPAEMLYQHASWFNSCERFGPRAQHASRAGSSVDSAVSSIAGRFGAGRISSGLRIFLRNLRGAVELRERIAATAGLCRGTRSKPGSQRDSKSLGIWIDAALQDRFLADFHTRVAFLASAESSSPASPPLVLATGVSRIGLPRNCTELAWTITKEYYRSKYSTHPIRRPGSYISIHKYANGSSTAAIHAIYVTCRNAGSEAPGQTTAMAPALLCSSGFAGNDKITDLLMQQMLLSGNSLLAPDS